MAKVSEGEPVGKDREIVDWLSVTCHSIIGIAALLKMVLQFRPVQRVICRFIKKRG